MDYCIIGLLDYLFYWIIRLLYYRIILIIGRQCLSYQDILFLIYKSNTVEIKNFFRIIYKKQFNFEFILTK